MTRGFWRDFSISAVVAGFVAVLIGFASSIALVFQAAQNLGATPGEMASWLWALGIGLAVTSIGLSLRYRQPVLMAWSTPGAAVVAAAAAGGGIGMPEAMGAFVVSAALIVLAGATGWFEAAMNRIPLALASALLAGVLTRFALDAFAVWPGEPALFLTMATAYLAGRRWWPRYAVVGVLLAGVAAAAATGLMHWEAMRWQVARPVWTKPVFSWHAVIGLAIPLFIVTMASQNLPGVAVIRASGYDTPVSPLVTWSGAATLVLAPFGGYAMNLAAITAAFCSGPAAHPDPRRRYVAPVVAGVGYLLMGLFGATIVGLLAAFPKALVLVLAGLALLGTIASGLEHAVHEPRYREPALVTFLVTLSGLTLAGIGSAFWGIVAGVVVLALQPRPQP